MAETTEYITLILLTNFVYMSMILSTGQLFIQYFSERFELQLADTRYLLLLRGSIGIFVHLVSLPGLSNFGVLTSAHLCVKEGPHLGQNLYIVFNHHLPPS